MSAPRRAWRVFVRRVRPRALVLLYHRIAEPSFDPHRLAVSAPAFARQLRALRARYHIISLEELLATRRRLTLRDGSVVITFDDGYADNLLAAYPVASALGVPITTFVTARPVLQGEAYWWDILARSVLRPAGTVPALVLPGGAGERLPVATTEERMATHAQLHGRLKRMRADDRGRLLAAVCACSPPGEAGDDPGRPMSPDELRAYARLPGVTIGAHTMTHPMLGALAAEDQREELIGGKESLQAVLGRSVTSLSYPFGKAGDFSRATRRLARRSGYDAAFSTVPQPLVPMSDPLALPRFSVHDWPDDEVLIRVGAFFT